MLTNLPLIHFALGLFKFIGCPYKIGPIIQINRSYNSSSSNKSPQILNERICVHCICLMDRTAPHLAINLLRVRMKEFVSIALATSMWTVLLAKQVNRAQYPFKSDLLSRILKGPNISTPQWVNGGASMHLSFGKSAKRLILFMLISKCPT